MPTAIDCRQPACRNVGDYASHVSTSKMPTSLTTASSFESLDANYRQTLNQCEDARPYDTRMHCYAKESLVRDFPAASLPSKAGTVPSPVI